MLRSGQFASAASKFAPHTLGTVVGDGDGALVRHWSTGTAKHAVPVGHRLPSPPGHCALLRHPARASSALVPHTLNGPAVGPAVGFVVGSGAVGGEKH